MGMIGRLIPYGLIQQYKGGSDGTAREPRSGPPVRYRNPTRPREIHDAQRQPYPVSTDRGFALLSAMAELEAERPGAHRLGEIAERAGLQPSQTNKLLAQAGARGLAERVGYGRYRLTGPLSAPAPAQAPAQAPDMGGADHESSGDHGRPGPHGGHVSRRGRESDAGHPDPDQGPGHASHAGLGPLDGRTGGWARPPQARPAPDESVHPLLLAVQRDVDGLAVALHVPHLLPGGQLLSVLVDLVCAHDQLQRVLEREGVQKPTGTAAGKAMLAALHGTRHEREPAALGHDSAPRERGGPPRRQVSRHRTRDWDSLAVVLRRRDRLLGALSVTGPGSWPEADAASWSAVLKRAAAVFGGVPQRRRPPVPPGRGPSRRTDGGEPPGGASEDSVKMM